MRSDVIALLNCCYAGLAINSVKHLSKGNFKWVPGLGCISDLEFLQVCLRIMLTPLAFRLNIITSCTDTELSWAPGDFSFGHLFIDVFKDSVVDILEAAAGNSSSSTTLLVYNLLCTQADNIGKRLLNGSHTSQE